MTLSPEAWPRARKVFEQALALPAADRPAYIAAACGSDHSLRRDIERMLESHERAAGFLSTPAAALFHETGAVQSLEDQWVGPYLVLSRIGAGGMGEVYRARDSRLKRDVALKILPSFFAGDSNRPHANAIGGDELRGRFLREARTAASISHPNVCHIYEVGEVPADAGLIAQPAEGALPPGTPFIAMELVEGQTLHAVLARSGRMPLKDLLRAAVEIADGMAAAHARRIVHRDLKPRNVMIDATGRVKILDFGLAKPLGAEPADSVMTVVDEHSAQLTRAGRILGTVAYMSPEQAAGRPLDERSDTFSFGTMLYEMATGSRPFDGETPTATMAKILEGELTPPSAVVAELPTELDRIIRRCLQKNPANRYNDSRDLLVDLKELHEAVSSGVVSRIDSRATPTRRTFARYAGLASGLVASLTVLAGLVFYLSERRAPAPGPVTHKQVSFTGSASAAAISPDGQFVAYVTGTGVENKVMVQEVAGGQPLEVLSGRVGGDVLWSPDGSELLVSSFLEALVLPRLGGTPRRFDGPSPYLSWSPDGTRFARAPSGNSAGHQIYLVEKSTGRETSIPLSGSFAFLRGIDWSPGGDRVSFATTSGSGSSALWTIGVDGSQRRQLLEGTAEVASPRWSAAGDVIYYLRSDEAGTWEVWKLRVARESGEAQGTPSLVLGGLPLVSRFTLSRDGKHIAFTRGLGYSNLWHLTIHETAQNAGISTVQLTVGTHDDTGPAISPDGRAVAFVRRVGDKTNVFLVPADGVAPRQLTFLNSAGQPAWSPDGKEIVFRSDEGGSTRVWRVGVTGGAPRVFARTRASRAVNQGQVGVNLAWTPGLKPLYQRPGNRNFHVLDPATEQETPLVKDESVGWAFSPTYSPDGGKVAVFWNRVLPSRLEGIWVVSVDDASESHVYKQRAFPVGWSPDGKSIYAIDENSPRRILRVPADGGEPRVVANLPWSTSVSCATSDARQFTCAVPQSSSDVWIVQNFDPDVR